MITNESGDISFHAHEDGALLFNAASRLLYGVDQIGGYCWLEFNDGKPIEEIEQALVDTFKIALDESCEWVRRVKALFETHNLLTSNPPKPMKISEPDSSTTGDIARPVLKSHQQSHCQLFDLSFSVAAIAADLSLLSPLLKPLMNEKEESLDAAIYIYEEEQGFRTILIDGAASRVGVPIGDLITTLEGIILTKALEHSDYFIALHAALVGPTAKESRGILLAGPSGSGKSTLSIAMGASGWLFGSDDLTILSRDLKARPSPLSPCVKDGALSIVERYYPNVRSEIDFDRFGRNARFAANVKQRCTVSDVSSVIYPRFEPGAETQLTLMERSQGLQRLLSQCLNVSADFSHDDVSHLAQWHNSLTYYVLPYSDVEAAMVAIEDAGLT